MGEVYRASDERLGRDVALKILPTVFDADTERVARFELEARATGKLNHPNIVSIYDVGEHNGRPYLVAELLEGETLRRYIELESPIPVRTVIDLGLQIARGLAAAHQKGIVHRDLKPANLFVSRDGHVKILDFGLAKLIHREWDATSEVETMSGLSVPGQVLGTVGYMAPEQIEARPADERSDIFALGAILYEMLTGRRPFSGSSTLSVVSAILKDEPVPVSQLRGDVPPALAAIIKRCLAKSASDRFQSAQDLAFALGELGSRSDVSFSSAAITLARELVGRIEPRRAAGFGGAGVIVIALALVIASSSGSGALPEPEQSGAPPTLTRLTASGRAEQLVGLSPDARYVVMATRTSTEEAELRLLHIATGSSSVIARAKGFGLADFSRDGNFVYFSREDERADLYRVPLLGDQPRLIARNVGTTLTFSPSGAELAFVRYFPEAKQSALVVVSTDGANERIVTRTDDNKLTLAQCAWSPDGARFFCSVTNNEVLLEVNALTGERQVRSDLPALNSLAWSRDGKSLIGTTPYVSGWQIVRLELATKKITAITSDPGQYWGVSLSRDGTTLASSRLDSRINLWRVAADDPTSFRQITSGTNTQDGNFGLDVGGDGAIVWSSKGTAKSIDLWISQSDGSDARRLTFDETADEVWPSISPDGKFVAYRRDRATPSGTVRDAFHVEIATGRVVQLTSTGDVMAPRYTADGERLVFHRGTARGDHAFEIPSAGGEMRQLGTRPATAPVPLPDAKSLLVTNYSRQPAALELRRYGTDDVLATFPIAPRMKRLTRDGKAVLFHRSSALWLQSLDGGAPRRLVSFGSQDFPMAYAWSPDGKEIIFSRRTDTRDIVLIRGLQ